MAEKPANGHAEPLSPMIAGDPARNGSHAMIPEPRCNRRAILASGLAAAAGLVLPSCASRRGPSTAALPGPAWPHERPAETIAKATPAPVASETTVKVGKLRLIPRTAWTRQQPNISDTNPMNGIQSITVHHDGMSPEIIRSQADAAARLELIRSSHVDSRGWADIGYHLIVDPQGRIWQGRPMNLQGAHVKDHNPHNLGVLVMGNFEEQHPTPQALATLDQLLANQAAVHRVPFGSIRTHQEWASTACPGRNLQAYMNTTRSRTGRLRSMMHNG